MEDSLSCPKIERGQRVLLPQQVTAARRFAAQWRATTAAPGTETPADVQEREEEVRRVYRAASFPPPRVYWFDSPTAYARSCAGRRALSFLHDTSREVTVSLLQALHNSETEIKIAVSVPLWEAVAALMQQEATQRAEATQNLWTLLRDQVRADLWAQSMLHMMRWPHTPSAPGWRTAGEANDVWEAIQGYDDNGGRLAILAFFHEWFAEQNLIHLARLVHAVSGYHLEERETCLIRKPTIFARDEEGLLHSAQGMALRYHDGTGLYAWHGTRVPAELILHPERLSPTNWWEESDPAIRRVIAERMPHFVDRMGGQCIDQGDYGALYELYLPRDPEGIARYVRVVDPSTGEQYDLRVPPHLRRADEAVAWTFGLTAATYHPRQEA